MSFNLAVVIQGTGPEGKVEVIKFRNAILRVPNGQSVPFDCVGHVYPDWQTTGWANVPFGLQGNRLITVSSQYENRTLDFPEWELGQYELTLNVIGSNKKSIQFPIMKFILDKAIIDTLNKQGYASVLSDF